MTGSADGFPSELLRSIEQEFQDRVPELFGACLGFAFIFGGFGKGYGSWGHDIDMFICVTGTSGDQETTFHDWYLDLHDRCSLPPDYRYPGEIVRLEDLLQRIRLLETRDIRPVVETLYEYEAILWTDALSEPKKAFTEGPAIAGDQMRSVIERANALNRRWRATMRSIRPESSAEQDKLDLRRLFKGYVTYLKGPDT